MPWRVRYTLLYERETFRQAPAAIEKDQQVVAQEPNARGAHPAQSQSLYRKYRPQSFAADELVGQEHIARTLRNAIALDRVAHAYLFCGPRGTGKTSTARLLAKAVNCLDPDPLQRPCNACAACDIINDGTTVDIIEIDAASNRGVDDIRDLREKVKYAPTQLRIKFYIIDEAHQLTRDAFNAFLKTLEEPPAHVKFVLATTEPDKLPDTVASRCQRFDFRRIPLPHMIARLRTVCQREGFSVEDEALRLVAQQATGSLRDALGLLDQLVLYAGESPADQPLITTDAVHRMLGLTRSNRLVDLVDALAQRDAGAGLRLIGDALDAGEDIRQLNRQLVAYLRQLLHLRAGGRDAGVDATAEDQAARFSLAELAAYTRIFSSVDAGLNRGSYGQLPLEIAFVEAVLQSSPNASAQAVARPEQATSTATRGTTPPSPRAPEPAAAPENRHVSPPSEPARSSAPPSEANGRSRPQPAAPAPTPANGDDAAIEQLVADWTRIRRDVKAANSRVAALLGSADPVALHGNEIVLVSPYEFHRNKLNEDAPRRVIEEVLSHYMGGSYRLRCVAPEDARLLSAANTAVTATAATAPSPPVHTSPAPPAEREPDADTDDEQRIRAAEAIFDAEPIAEKPG